MIFCKSLGNLEIDYDKKEVRAGGRRISFGQISHYEYNHEKTEYGDYDPQDSDAREHLLRQKEIMRVCGKCVELPSDYHPFSVTPGFDEVVLQIFFNYYQGEELKQSSLVFTQNDALNARNKLKPLIEQLRERRASDDFNMFIGEEHLRIGNIVSLNVPLKDFNIHKADLPIFGTCSVHAYGKEVVTISCISKAISDMCYFPVLERDITDIINFCVEKFGLGLEPYKYFFAVCI